MAKKHAKITDSEALDLVRARVDIRGEGHERRAYDRTALLNRAFFFGKQHFIEDIRTGRFRDPVSLPQYRALYKANFIKGDLLRAILTVTGAKGEFVVPPADNTKKAQHAAWVSTKLFEHFARILKLEVKDQAAAMFAALDGSVFWKPVWNPEKGEPDRYYEPPELKGRAILDVDPQTQQRLEDAGQYRDIPPGDVDVELWPLFQFDWDWGAREGGIDDCQWIAFKQAIYMEKLEEMYPTMAHLVKPDETLQGSLYYNEAISFMSGGQGPVAGYRARQDDQRPRTVLIEYFERPSMRNGMLGRRLVVAGDTALENGENPYRRTHFPLPAVKQDWVMAPGRFVGLSLVEDLTNLQSHHNRMMAKGVEHANVFGAPAIFVPENSGIPTGHYSVVPGSVYSYKATGAKIEIGPTPNLPKEVMETAAAARAAMAEISSQPSLDGSKLPGQLRSGPALDTMFEERNKMLTHPAAMFLVAKAQVGQQLLEIAKLRYTPQRVIRYIGDDRKFRALSFLAADIQTELHVIIDRGKMLTSPSATRARIMEMVQIGVVDPMNSPEDKIAVFKALEFGGVDELISDRIKEEENQERELLEMEQQAQELIQPRMDHMAPEPEPGQPPQVTRGLPINPYDDDESHVRVLLRFVRSDEFRELKPIPQQVILLHLQQHQARIQQKMMQQMMLQEAMRGGQGQKGKPSAPKAQVG